MEDTQNLINKITLLIECVNFYNNGDNYLKNQNNNTQSLIELDGGHTARHTLQIVGKLNDFDIEMNQLINTLDTMASPEEISNKVSEIINKIEE